MRLCPFAVAAILGLAACADRDPSEPTAPRSNPASQARGGLLEQFPEMVEFVPALRLAGDPLPPELSDADLVESVRQAGGRVMIGFKP
ncbi:MAG: hypothetical protein ACREN5_05380, partial [Gemmatimonadales bacterium]